MSGRASGKTSRALPASASASAKSYWTPARCKTHCGCTSGLCWERCVGAKTFEQLGKEQDACIQAKRSDPKMWDDGVFLYNHAFKQCGAQVGSFTSGPL